MREQATNREVIASGDFAVEVKQSALEKDRSCGGGGDDLGNGSKIEDCFGGYGRGTRVIRMSPESAQCDQLAVRQNRNRRGRKCTRSNRFLKDLIRRAKAV